MFSKLNPSLVRLPVRSLYFRQALSTYNLRNIITSWPKLKLEERDQIIDFLQERQILPWTDLSNEEKRACYYISFGQWGPRLLEQADNAQGVSSRIISTLTASVILIALGLSVMNYTADEEKLNELNQYELVNPEN